MVSDVELGREQEARVYILGIRGKSRQLVLIGFGKLLLQLWLTAKKGHRVLKCI